MSRRTWYLALGLEAVACIVFVSFRASVHGLFTTAMAFPLEQIGLLLRKLSLPGGVGNAAAFVIYAAICLVPAAAVLALLKMSLSMSKSSLSFLRRGEFLPALLRIRQSGSLRHRCRALKIRRCL